MKYDVFLSHNSSDKAFVEQIASKLVDEAGIKPFIDIWNIVPGEKWQEAVEEALDSSSTCAVFLGPHGLGNWESQEMRSAIDSYVTTGTLRIIPVLLPGVDAKIITSLPRFLRHLTWVDYSEGLESAKGFIRLVAAIKGETPGRISSSEVTNVSMAPNSPLHKIVGRDLLLAKIKQRLLRRDSVALNGLPGVGKTAIAIELANDSMVLEEFNYNILWMSLGQQSDIHLALSETAEALNIPIEMFSELISAEDKVKAINTSIGQREFLIVIDDAVSIEQAFDFKVGNINCAYLLTTNNLQAAIAFDSNENETIKELDQEDGLDLLSQFIPGVVRSDPASSIDLITLVGGLPLALVLIGNHLKIKTRGRPKNLLKIELEKILGKAAERFSVTLPSGRLTRNYSLDTVIGMSVSELSSNELNALKNLCLFPPKPNSFSEESALNISGTQPEDVYSLIDHGLLEFIEPDRFTINRLIVDYMKLTNDQFSSIESIERMSQFFISKIKNNEFTNQQIELESLNILRNLDSLYSNGLYELFVVEVNLFFPSLEHQGRYELAGDLIGKVLSISSGNIDEAEFVLCKLNMGIVLLYQDNYKKAVKLFLEGMGKAEKNHDELTQCKLCHRLGKAYFMLSIVGKDEKYLLEALTLARKIGNTDLEVDILASLGEMEDIRGNYTKAEMFFKEGIDLASAANNEERHCNLLSHLGWVLAHFGEFDKAEKIWKEGMSIARKLCLRSNIAFYFSVLGWVVDRQGRYEEAEHFLNEGLQMAKEIGYLHLISILNTNLGAAKIHRGDYEGARKALEEGLGIVLSSGHAERRAILLENLGIIESRLGNFCKAEEFYNEGMALASTGIKERVSALNAFLGEIEIRRKNFTKAEKLLKESLSLASEIKNPERLALSCRLLGVLSLENEDLDAALHFFNQAFDHANRLSYKWLISCIYSDIGTAMLNIDGKSSMENFKKALEIAIEINSKDMRAKALFGIAQSKHSSGEVVEAIRFSDESLSLYSEIKHINWVEVKDWKNRYL